VSSNAAPVVVRVLLAVVGSVLGFVLLQWPVRMMESRAATALVRLSGTQGVFLVDDTSILVVPTHRTPFRATVTPSCSAISSVLAIACLAMVSSPQRRPRCALAFGVALAAIAAGNILRIAASVGVGYLAGRAALVLFHDWVGSTFAFAYTLGGYVLMLYILLPRHTPRNAHVRLG
jgi:exosortase/archaeosortase family protein